MKITYCYSKDNETVKILSFDGFITRKEFLICYKSLPLERPVFWLEDNRILAIMDESVAIFKNGWFTYIGVGDVFTCRQMVIIRNALEQFAKSIKYCEALREEEEQFNLDGIQTIEF